MLAQLVLSIVMTVKMVGASSPADARSAIDWMQYVMLLNAGATLAMMVGVLRAIPELARARMNIRGLVIGAAGFAIATAALAWSYHVITTFVELAFSPSSSLADLEASADDLDSLKTVAIVKDLAYAVGLISVLRTVEKSAALNDQLALRDEAAGMSRALVVMLVADLFYQLTYGLGGIGILGVVGSLLVGGYWIYCHVRLARFLFNAAYFVNEPHDLPLATVVRVPEPARKPAAPPAAPRETKPSVPRPAATRPAIMPPPAVVAPPPAAAPPRAASSSDGEPDPGGPRFLR